MDPYWSAEVVHVLRSRGSLGDLSRAFNARPLAYPQHDALVGPPGTTSSWRSLLEVAILEGSEDTALWLARELVNSILQPWTVPSDLLCGSEARYAAWLPAGQPTTGGGAAVMKPTVRILEVRNTSKGAEGWKHPRFGSTR